METKSLKTIQTICKVGSIIDKIAHTFCIVAAIISAVILILSAFGLQEYLIVGDPETIEKYIDMDLTFGTVVVTCLVVLIESIAGIYETTVGAKFFKKELEVGHPFDYEVSEKLKKYGITKIVAPLLATILSSIAYEVCSYIFGVSKNIEVSNEINLGIGIMLIIVSVILKYGAEQRELNEVNKDVRD